MRTWLAAACLVIFLATPAIAGPIERGLEARWRGAYVILEVEARSHCSSSYTDNRVNGRLSQSRGRFAFPEGELGQIKNLSVRRSRVDVLVDLYEPRLVPRVVGPFTLYDRLHCKVELEIEVPRSAVRARDVGAIDGILAQAMTRHATLREAQDSDLWNGRECEGLPEDYAETLRAYEIWKIEQHNAAIEDKLIEATDVLAAVSRSISSDEHYLSGFAAGVDEARADRMATSCALIGSRDLDRPRRRAPGHLTDAEDRRRWESGFADGVLLLRALHLRQHLPACLQPVPES